MQGCWDKLTGPAELVSSRVPNFPGLGNCGVQAQLTKTSSFSPPPHVHICAQGAVHIHEKFHVHTHLPTYINTYVETSSSPLEEEEQLQLYRNVRKRERASGAMKDDIEV